MSEGESEQSHEPSEEYQSAKGEEEREDIEDATVIPDDAGANRESTATEVSSKIIEIKGERTAHEEDDLSTMIRPEGSDQDTQDEYFHASMHYLKMQLQQEELKEVDMEQFKINEKDSKDPSYTNLVLPYRVICRQRYRRAGATQRAQFIKEIKQHELLQSKALDGVRIHREFCNAIISQPKAEEMIRLSDKQKQRLEWIMQNEIR